MNSLRKLRQDRTRADLASVEALIDQLTDQDVMMRIGLESRRTELRTAIEASPSPDFREVGGSVKDTYTIGIIRPPPSVVVPHRLSALTAIAALTPPGSFVEVGVYQGGSAFALSQIAEYQGRELHLFDTFAGMPVSCDADQYKIGDFGDVDLDAIRKSIPAAQFHVGTFPDTMPSDLTDIAFVHVDCDQWESYRACIDLLWPRLVDGGAMVFDDYPWLEGARKAVTESFPGVRRMGDTFFAVKVENDAQAIYSVD